MFILQLKQGDFVEVKFKVEGRKERVVVYVGEVSYICNCASLKIQQILKLSSG